MKIETNSPTAIQSLQGTEKGASTDATNRLLSDPALIQGGTVTAQPPSGNSGAPEIPAPSETSSVDSTTFGGDKTIDIQQLLMWIATMAAEYIKQQNELNVTRQKAVEQGFTASIDAAQKNYDKNMTQAIVGIVGASVSLAGAGFAGFKLAGASKTVKGLDPSDVDAFKTKTLSIDQSTQVAQSVNAMASGASQGAQGIAGTVTAGQEFDAKAQEALAQLIAKTADSITSNEGATRQIIDKFVNDLMAMLKNFTASSVR
jgi:cytochrome c556